MNLIICLEVGYVIVSQSVCLFVCLFVFCVFLFFQYVSVIKK